MTGRLSAMKSPLWRATAELRIVRAKKAKREVFQQLWIDINSDKTEWRDVPVVEAE